ncbi:hypothetical protein VE01_10746 [Pseudogymnoascus verrucosus]|uniref:Uncharacterized protein n=1 Tax=Pseudogymnoascus verrucosus TaxID=342668 RepID=A0A2P6FGT1_9PEZI|nr:uncharacterized protein VE01_10746 [Pseudogymnoascus verrucosus]PQM43850.1 hypothetical protein VE01_10746 [Pseudogymnoascus verrucosus]
MDRNNSRIGGRAGKECVSRERHNPPPTTHNPQLTPTLSKQIHISTYNQQATASHKDNFQARPQDNDKESESGVWGSLGVRVVVVSISGDDTFFFARAVWEQWVVLSSVSHCCCGFILVVVQFPTGTPFLQPSSHHHPLSHDPFPTTTHHPRWTLNNAPRTILPDRRQKNEVRPKNAWYHPLPSLLV